MVWSRLSWILAREDWSKVTVTPLTAQRQARIEKCSKPATVLRKYFKLDGENLSNLLQISDIFPLGLHHLGEQPVQLGLQPLPGRGLLLLPLHVDCQALHQVVQVCADLHHHAESCIYYLDMYYIYIIV